MINWKAIIFGAIATVLAGLINNLIFVLFAAYIANSKSSPFMAEYGDMLAYAIGIAGLFIAMACGGFITAFCARERVIVHGAIVGLLASCTSLALSANTGVLTPISVLFLAMGAGFTVVGCIIWTKCPSYIPKTEQISWVTPKQPKFRSFHQLTLQARKHPWYLCLEVRAKKYDNPN